MKIPVTASKNKAILKLMGLLLMGNCTTYSQHLTAENVYDKYITAVTNLSTIECEVDFRGYGSRSVNTITVNGKVKFKKTNAKAGFSSVVESLITSPAAENAFGEKIIIENDQVFSWDSSQGKYIHYGNFLEEGNRYSGYNKLAWFTYLGKNELYNTKKPSQSFDSLSTVVIDGSVCYRLLRQEEKMSVFFYIDTLTFLPVRIEYFAPDRSGVTVTSIKNTVANAGIQNNIFQIAPELITTAKVNTGSNKVNVNNNKNNSLFVKGAHFNLTVPVKDMNGMLISPESIKGKIIVLNFWFVKCAPCVSEIPLLNELVSQYAGNKEIIFLSFALDNATDIKQFLKRKKFSYKIVPDAASVSEKFKVTAYPTNVIINKQGIVSHAEIGYVDDIKKKFSTILDSL